ncbi:hypothetical protein TrST_g9124 [Triparma strigata]|uniref:Transmembrane 9 superfamily member n=1 Tax=Triparma strigata TaxID=1606541 RepID=A0A9W7ALX2_9STRA|nr:hypothetical protein TrST_g9124 [Triparma strigata]
MIRLLVAAGLLAAASGFYLPGVDPKTFSPNAPVEMKVNTITSTHTQLPLDYYSQPFCKPDGGPKAASENLGEFLTGSKIQSSPYHIYMLLEDFCHVLCQKTLSKSDASSLQEVISQEYHNHWIIDNLPSAMIVNSDNLMYTEYAGGFLIGFVGTDKVTYLFNHVKILIEYHQVVPDEEGYRIVGFYVEPISVKHHYVDGWEWDGVAVEGRSRPLETCSNSQWLNSDQVEEFQTVKEGEQVLFTYDVIWSESETKWASRWDIYLSMDNRVPARIHWFSIINSLLIICFLSAIVGMILVKNLKRDISNYNRVLTDEEKAEEREESGWKLVHADVFRPPYNNPMIFCVFVGTGTQLMMMIGITIALASIGFLSPAKRGSMMMMIIVMYVLNGATAGYVSSRLYKSFRGRAWQRCTILTAVAFPGAAFVFFLFCNIVLSIYHSSAAVPFLQILSVMALWCCVSIPLVFLGAFFGYKKEMWEYPCVTSTIPREIRPLPWYLQPWAVIAMGGVLPFGAAYVELFFILSSIWMEQFYYVFGVCFVVCLILGITCGELSILFCYFQLCAEDHRWHWRAFLICGSTAFYVFGYSTVWFNLLEPSKLLITYLLYFGYMALISFGIFLVTGTIGFMSCFWFTNLIYSSIKVD